MELLLAQVFWLTISYTQINGVGGIMLLSSQSSHRKICFHDTGHFLWQFLETQGEGTFMLEGGGCFEGKGHLSGSKCQMGAKRTMQNANALELEAVWIFGGKSNV